ncbi:hypothetical protein MHAS44199_17955 [Mycolicibacterium hassiacum DSM 44199]|nr:hypothetical protein [Mycolicibacterium hassiacum DSM 44199]PZN18266.1 MAG: hypothetical protein DIU75_17435 [Mycolicibacterium hassiacum]
MLTSVKQPAGVATAQWACHNEVVAENKKKHYVDPGWPTVSDGEHAVSELAADRVGALSPFGELEFPLPADQLPYCHPVTVVNR